MPRSMCVAGSWDRAGRKGKECMWSLVFLPHQMRRNIAAAAAAAAVAVILVRV